MELGAWERASLFSENTVVFQGLFWGEILRDLCSFFAENCTENDLQNGRKNLTKMWNK